MYNIENTSRTNKTFTEVGQTYQDDKGGSEDILDINQSDTENANEQEEMEDEILDFSAIEGGEIIDDTELYAISQIESVMEDQEQHIVDSAYVCGICNMAFRNISSLKYHKKHRVCLKPKRGDAEKILQCEKCEKVFATGHGFKYHVRRSVCEAEKEEPKLLECTQCNKIFATNHGLSYHIRRKVCEQVEEVKEEEIIQCKQCETVFRHKHSLTYHINRKVCLRSKKDENEPLQCGLCEKVFSTPTAVTYHVKHNVCAPKEPKEVKVEEEKECHLCNALFKHAHSLRYHLAHKVCLKPKIDKSEPKILQCEKCEKVFSSTTAVEYHLKRRVCEQVKPVIPGPPFICDICNTSFELRQTWYAHIQRQACKKYPERYMQDKELEISVKIEPE